MANSSINLQPLLFESDEGGVGGGEGEVGGRKENRGWGEGVDQRKTVGQNGEINFWLDFQSGLNSLSGHHRAFRPPCYA